MARYFLLSLSLDLSTVSQNLGSLMLREESLFLLTKELLAMVKLELIREYLAMREFFSRI